jgi:hypothetical protein
MTSDLALLVLIVFGAAASVLGGIAAMFFLAMRRVDANFDKLDAWFDKIEGRFDKLAERLAR